MIRPDPKSSLPRTTFRASTSSARALALLLCAPSLVGGCGAAADPGTDTSTNWVRSCNTDAECDEKSSCECNICTTACEANTDCHSLDRDAVCKSVSTACSSAAALCVPDQSFELGVDKGMDQGVDDTDDDDTLPAGILPALARWTVVDPDRYASALSVDADTNFYVTGGQGRMPADLSVAFDNLWLARFGDSGALAWEQIVPTEEDESNGRSVAVEESGDVTVVSTTYDGSDTPTLRQFSTDGEALLEYTLEPGITALRADRDWGLVGAGSNLVDFTAGRPFTELWIGGIEAGATTWQEQIRGDDRSISNARSFAFDQAGNYYVAGSRGNAADSNASDAWLGMGSPESGIEWDIVPVAGGGNGRAMSVSVSPRGEVLVGGVGQEAFAHVYDGATHELTRELSLEGSPSVVLATKSAYLVAYEGYYYGGGFNEEEPPARLDYFARDGSLTWRYENPDCEGVNDLLALEDSVIVALRCDGGMGLVSVAYVQATPGLAGSVEEFGACQVDLDCVVGLDCNQGTCSKPCTLSEQCGGDADYRCVHETLEGGDCPFLAVGELGTAGACLPRCFSHEDCKSVASSLSCWNNYCVNEMPECEVRCSTLQDGACANGCSEIEGRGLAPEDDCFATEPELLGCYPSGRGSTDDDGCVKSPDGVVYSAGGLYASTLMRNYGFVQCSSEDDERWSNASTCD